MHDAVTTGQRQAFVTFETGRLEPGSILGFGVGLTVRVDIQEHDVHRHRFQRGQTRVVEHTPDHETTAAGT